MSSLAEIQNKIAPDLEKLNIRIRSQLSTSNPLMDSVIEGFLRNKGKQIRPLIVLLTAKMFAPKVNDNVIAAGAAVELLHSASLIHDDVVDNSRLRRNAPTINAVWDNHIAVLIGDFFVSSAMQQAISTADVRIIEALCHLGKLLSMGELDQIYNARYHKLTEEAYFQIISYKTASLFVACARMGCFAVGASDEDTARMAEFAELLGLCFQIRDDIFDYYHSEKVGKPTGNDLREGKITLPLLAVLNGAPVEGQQAMRELSMKESLTDEEIATLLAFARDNGGIRYAFEKMGELRTRAAAIMAEFPDSQASKHLMAIFDYIISRDF